MPMTCKVLVRTMILYAPMMLSQRLSLCLKPLLMVTSQPTHAKRIAKLEKQARRARSEAQAADRCGRRSFAVNLV
jgi:hypothetical protein